MKLLNSSSLDRLSARTFAVLFAACGTSFHLFGCQESTAPADAADTTSASADGNEETLDTGAGSDRHPLCDQVANLCASPETAPVVGTPHIVAPSDTLPAEFISQTAHNNLDVTWHDGRLFAAIRTAPSHFASPKTHLYIVSTADLNAWRFEGDVSLGTDVREPQLVSFNNRLWLYYAVLGDSPFDFEPQGVERREYAGPDNWSAPEPVFPQSMIVWRIKTINNQLHAIGYTGGDAIYNAGGALISAQWFISEDGEAWRPMTGGADGFRQGGGSEWDFVLNDPGHLLAVARNEDGDGLGFGSHVCRADPGDLTRWECIGDRRKFDSPLMLGTSDDAWLIARRNVTETGFYDLGLDGDRDSLFLKYQLDYWTRPKRCSLWNVDRNTLTVDHVADLPSRGDTCFPEAVSLGQRQYLVFNYTSPLDEESGDPGWQVAQGGPTLVYWTVVTLPPPTP